MRKTTELLDGKAGLAAAEAAARAAGALMRLNLRRPKRANEVTRFDIKLELDVRCQKLIQRRLAAGFSGVALLGEEGISGDPASEWRWVVDPIDGTVNFAYGIPHACVSIALQRRGVHPGSSTYQDGYHTVAGVVYDPFAEEMWTARIGQPARLNGRRIQVSDRSRIDEAVVSIGFSKTAETLAKMLPYFNQLVPRVRKVRIMGAAALALTYVASGRFDAYIERGIRIWDIAAGGFILEQAGGEFWREATDNDHSYRMIAANRHMRRKLGSVPF